MAQKVFDAFYLIPIEEYDRLIKCQAAAAADNIKSVTPPGIPHVDNKLQANGEDPVTRDYITGAGWLEQWTPLD